MKIAPRKNSFQIGNSKFAVLLFIYYENNCPHPLDKLANFVFVFAASRVKQNELPLHCPKCV